MSFCGGETSENMEEEPSVAATSSEVTETPQKKENHTKRKKRRRGKKRKQRKESTSFETEGEVPPTWDSDEDLSCDTGAFTNVVIRPINVPKAPENSTQFIMDDHDECRLYMSFETPNPYLADPSHPSDENYVVTEPIGEDAAYQDIDYEYESPQDFDNSAYYDREFELSYNNNRYEELMRLSRTEIISALENLEFRLRELEDDFMKQNPSHVLERLQSELLQLQEENMMLKECNSRLNVLVIKNDTDESISEQSHDEDLQHKNTKVLKSDDTQSQGSCDEPSENILPSLDTISYELSSTGFVGGEKSNSDSALLQNSPVSISKKSVPVETVTCGVSSPQCVQKNKSNCCKNDRSHRSRGNCSFEMLPSSETVFCKFSSSGHVHHEESNHCKDVHLQHSPDFCEEKLSNFKTVFCELPSDRCVHGKES